jgi:hemoglobin-like flavoprotein
VELAGAGEGTTRLGGGVAVSLQRYAERHGDPVDHVYERLFALHPETQHLFLLDRNGAARGNMLANVFAILLDLDDEPDFAHNMIAAEVLNHVDLGVAPATFVGFFDLLRDVVREGLGEEWRDEAADAWALAIERAKVAAAGSI